MIYVRYKIYAYTIINHMKQRALLSNATLPPRVKVEQLSEPIQQPQSLEPILIKHIYFVWYFLSFNDIILVRSATICLILKIYCGVICR